MRPYTLFRCLFTASALMAYGWATPAIATRDEADLAAVIAQVGDRLAGYYRRAQQLVCLERSTVVPIGTDWRLQGFGRTVDSELRVELDAADGGGLPDARITRETWRINGREPRARDLTDRSGCTDPSSLEPDLLAFLLPSHRGEFVFTRVRSGKERERAALVIDFASVRQRGHPELIADEQGRHDCFKWEGPIPIAGRVWVDAATHDVLRLERRVAGPTDVRVPFAVQRKYNLPAWLTLERDDLTLRYKEVAFRDPDETLLLPESIESLTVFRTGLQSVRRTQVLSDYRRFLTGGRIIKGS